MKLLYFANHMRQILFALTGLFLILDSTAQSIQTEFGKNRVQYHDDFKDWWQYETDNFITYWYGKSRFVARPTILMAEGDHDELQRVLEHRMNDKIEIIVYTDISDLKQSNIGTEESLTSRAGETRIVGNKMFVYFDGNHLHLRQQIRKGIASVFLNNMLFGSNIQEIIQNAILLNIPDWYKEGVIAYAASEWNQDAEHALKDLWNKHKKYQNFNKMAEENPSLAGHSFWFFVTKQYGKGSVSNLLYLTKISRSIDNGFEYVLNTSLDALKNDWKQYYSQKFALEQKTDAPFPYKNTLHPGLKTEAVISQVRMSPDGSQLAFTTNDKGRVKVFLRDLKRKKNKKIYSVSYINDLDYIFSASTDGYSDLYKYLSKNRNYQRITEDYFDDLDAVFTKIGNQNGFLFATNRISDSISTLRFDTILPLMPYDIAFLPENSKTIQWLTRTPFASERQPASASPQSITYISDISGKYNSFRTDFRLTGPFSILPKWEDAVYPTTQISDYNQKLVFQDMVSEKNQLLSILIFEGKHVLVLQDSVTSIRKLSDTGQINESTSPDQKVTTKPTVPNETLDQRSSEWKKYTFQSRFPDPVTPPTNRQPIIPAPIVSKSTILPIVPQTIRPKEAYDNTRAIAANRKFALFQITTKMDNDLLFEGLESYTGDRQQLLTMPLGLLVKANVVDIFEDYKVEGGLRIPATFNGAEYFLLFNNHKYRIDRKFALYRRSTEYNAPSDPNQNFTLRSKKTTLLGLYQWKYPFDVYRSMRATASLRFDRFFQLSTEVNSFRSPVIHEKRASLKLEYIFDNTHDESLNIKHGTRYKFYLEAINAFDLQVIDGFSFDGSKGFTGILGFDARHYIPVLKRSVLALRAAGASSFGSEKMLYYIGGMENWFFPSFNNQIPVPSEDFAYKANAFQMRGFNNNIRNGTTFLLANTELRIPFMQYILGKYKGNNFIRNIQLTGFMDAGLAFHGTGPFSKENPLNNITLVSPPLLELNIKYFRDPVVFGYGFGLRTQLLGYFVKVDYGWGVETRTVQKPRLYVSFGLDF